MKYADAIHSNERTRNDTPSFTIAGRMSDTIEVRAAEGRREIRRFVDYMYERNAGDPHWVPPLRIGEHERLNPKKNPFFAHASVQLMLAWRGGRGRRPHRGDR